MSALRAKLGFSILFSRRFLINSARYTQFMPSRKERIIEYNGI